jgi:hypothetical protein
MSIGGYFELEISRDKEYHKNLLSLNSGRNCLAYILKSKKYKKIFLPYYSCNSLREICTKMNIEIEFYNIDKSFSPIYNNIYLDDSSCILYINYYGLCSKIVKFLSTKFDNLIIDNSQSFFERPLKNFDTFYSPRKFFGVPDGGYLYTKTECEEDFEMDNSYDRFNHLIGRIENGPEAHYIEFRLQSQLFSNYPIKIMSKITKLMLKGINYKKISRIRKNNFQILDNALKHKNQLSFKLTRKQVPLIYPYLSNDGEKIKEKLIDNKVYVATYWHNSFENKNYNEWENFLSKNLVAIPIDQRIGKVEVNYIISLLK